MGIPKFGPFISCLPALVLAGCSVQGSSSPALGYADVGAAYPGPGYRAQNSAAFAFAAGRAITPHPDRHKSWISPELKADSIHRFLFESDYGNDDLYVYALPSLALMATLTGFNGPAGLCSDDSGDVWVVNIFSQNILKYSHHAKLLSTLNDPSGYPVGCAWDKTTGNLAVGNEFDFYGHGDQPGTVLIYPGASGTPTSYADSDIYAYIFLGYDNHGNLFVDGHSFDTFNFLLGELPHGSDSMSTISIAGGTIYYPGMVQWDAAANALVVGDENCGNNLLAEKPCIYTVSIAGSVGTITGSATLNNGSGSPACVVAQPVRMGSSLYGGDIEYASDYPFEQCASGASPPASGVYQWPYPGGGNPVRASTNGMIAPEGAAISK